MFHPAQVPRPSCALVTTTKTRDKMNIDRVYSGLGIQPWLGNWIWLLLTEHGVAMTYTVSWMGKKCMDAWLVGLECMVYVVRVPHALLH